jgi:type I restriction enzyme S subunit
MLTKPLSPASPPSGWQYIPLGSLGVLTRGRGGTRSDERSDGLPCVRYGELYTKHDFVVRSFYSFISPKDAASYSPISTGDVLFASSGETHGEIGKAAVYCGAEPAHAGGDIIIFRPSGSLVPRFAGYAVNSPESNRYKSRMGQGSSVIHLAESHLRGLVIPLPPLAEQRLIVKVLDTADEVIRKIKQIIAKQKQIKQGLLHDLFTRGIDENGELRDPERHPEQFKDSLLGRIPKVWATPLLASLGIGLVAPSRG